MLFVVMCLCVYVWVCGVCADPLNFAADQAEIEIYGMKKTAAREMGSEAETEEGKDEETVRQEKVQNEKD